MFAVNQIIQTTNTLPLIRTRGDSRESTEMTVERYRKDSRESAERIVERILRRCGGLVVRVSASRSPVPCSNLSPRPPHSVV